MSFNHRSLPMINVPQFGIMGKFLIFLVIFFSVFSKNPFETLFGLFTLGLIINFFWKINKVIILAYCLIWHWLEIYTSVLESNYYSLSLNDNYYGTGQEAAWLAGLGLVSIISGLYVSSKNSLNSTIEPESLVRDSLEINLKKLSMVYLIAFVLSIFLGNIAFRIPQITQLIIHFSSLKLIIYILIAYVVFLRKSGYWILAFVTILEFVSGLYSYFSDFKITFIVLAITYIITIKKVKFSQILFYLLIFILAFVSLFYWQIIKEDYRKFVNSSGTMSVNTSFGESMNKLFDLGSNVRESDFNDNIKTVFRRLGYLEPFASALRRVPDLIPYENGQLLLSNLEYVFIPRFFNPNKKEKNDTDKIVKYAGKVVWTKGSFSLSYYAEAFVDFGPIGMMVFLFIFGWIVGKVYLACFALKGLNTLFHYSITTVVLFPFATYGSDAIQLFGSLFWGAVAHLIIFVPVYRYINKIVKNQKTT
jgi:hypothetical protein